MLNDITRKNSNVDDNKRGTEMDIQTQYWNKYL